MRQSVAAIVLMIGMPGIAAAQSSPVPLPELSPTLPPIGLPLPPIGLPLPAIGLPLPSIGLPPLAEQPPAGSQLSRGPERPSQTSGSPRSTSTRRSGRTVPSVIYVVPPYGWGYPQAPQPSPGIIGSSAGPIEPPPAAAGRLRLEVQADGEVPQVFVDGYFVGALDELRGGELEIEPGPHTINVRATGYESLTFDVRIEANRPITYRGTLKRAPAQNASASTSAPRPDTPDAPVAAPAPPPTTLYFIPGCYLGNVPPGDIALPARCDMSRLVVHKP